MFGEIEIEIEQIERYNEGYNKRWSLILDLESFQLHLKNYGKPRVREVCITQVDGEFIENGHKSYWGEH